MAKGNKKKKGGKKMHQTLMRLPNEKNFKSGSQIKMYDLIT